jgi:hypothetical protein
MIRAKSLKDTSGDGSTVESSRRHDRIDLVEQAIRHIHDDVTNKLTSERRRSNQVTKKE